MVRGPGLLAGLRPLRCRVERRDGAAEPSAEGGCEEFRELRPSLRSSSATCAVSTSI
jgi:hypothetical protein